MNKIYHFFNTEQHHHVIPFIRKFGENHKNPQEYILIGKNKNGNYNDIQQEAKHIIKFVDKLTLPLIMGRIFLEAKSSIVLHGFNLEFLIINKVFYFKKCSTKWICWGAGIIEKNGLIGKIENYLKTWVYNGFDLINVLMKPDAEFLCKHKVNPNKIRTIPYPKIINQKKLSQLKEKKEVNILIGNSASQANKHIELIELLKKIEPKKIKEVIVFFGYGGSSIEYKQEVEKLGNSAFTNKFKIHKDMLSLDDYALVMSNVDIIIIAGLTQTGLGAIYTGLENGSTIYVEKNGRNAEWLMTLGIKFKCISEIGTEENLTLELDAIENNRIIYNKKFGQQKIISEWNEFINSN